MEKHKNLSWDYEHKLLRGRGSFISGKASWRFYTRICYSHAGDNPVLLFVACAPQGQSHQNWRDCPPTPSPCIDDTVAISFGKSKTKGQTVHQREHKFDLPPSSPWHNEDSRNYRHYGVIAGTPQSWWEEQQVIILSWDEQMSILVIVWSAVMIDSTLMHDYVYCKLPSWRHQICQHCTCQHCLE